MISFPTTKSLQQPIVKSNPKRGKNKRAYNLQFPGRYEMGINQRLHKGKCLSELFTSLWLHRFKQVKILFNSWENVPASLLAQSKEKQHSLLWQNQHPTNGLFVLGRHEPFISEFCEIKQAYVVLNTVSQTPWQALRLHQPVLKNIRNKDDGENDGDGDDKVAFSSFCPTFQLSTVMEIF